MAELKYGSKEVVIKNVASGGGLVKVAFYKGGELPASLKGTWTSKHIAEAAVKFAESQRADKDGESPVREDKPESQAKPRGRPSKKKDSKED